MNSHANSNVSTFLAGPCVFVILLAFLAILVLGCWGLRRLDSLAGLGERAARRLVRRRALPTLWGLSASVLFFAASVLLFQTHVLALLGVLLLTAGLLLTGAGVGVAARVLGNDVAMAMGTPSEDVLASLRLGLAVLFGATWLPVIGWLLFILLAAAGLGAVLEALLTRET